MAFTEAYFTSMSKATAPANLGNKISVLSFLSNLSISRHLPDNTAVLTIHFLQHGIHHYLPMDKYRLVTPPAVFLLYAMPLWKLIHIMFWYNWYAATAVYCGGIFGYVCFEVTHYLVHHKNLPPLFRSLKKYHLQHHFLDSELGFGITSKIWDKAFGTVLQPNFKGH